jgi:luciferase family oxidoreductase group 1
MPPLSVLDLSFVTSGTPPSATLRNTLDLARHADRLGYTRYWVAEHHNLPSVASPAPEIMIGQIAAVTERIRVGSGGVMLPNHAPLVVAERFKTLEALFPGRIDLGVGRAPGTDQVTAFALRRLQEQRGDDFLERLQELVFWDRGFPEGHPFGRIVAMPSDAPLPPIWILGSSDYGGRLAANIGVGFAFAHHFASVDAVAVMRMYRDGFNSGGFEERPYAILAVAAVCADTDAEAERLASGMDLNWLRREHGEYVPLPSPEEAAAYPYTDADRARIAKNRARLFVGSPAAVKRKLAAMTEASGADEVMVTSAIYDHEARKRSYELLAKAFAA